MTFRLVVAEIVSPQVVCHTAARSVHFIFVHGVLFVGGGLFLMMFVGTELVGFPFLKPTSSWLQTAQHLLICVAGGVVWGLLTWHINERLFVRYSNLAP